MNATAARHQQRAETIQEAMRYLKVSEPVQHRVSVRPHPPRRQLNSTIISPEEAQMPELRARVTSTERVPCRSTTTFCRRSRTRGPT